MEPLRRSPLVEQATQRLREQITSGQWPVGTRLPGETTLAKELGVGRSTIREALRALAGASMVEARQGSGVFVLSASPLESWDLRLRRAGLADVFEVRTLLEVQAARLAALRRDVDDLAAMDAALEERRAAALSPDEVFVDADIALHTAVVAAAHNPVLAALFHDFRPRLRAGLLDLLRLVPLREASPDPGDEAHAGIVEAIRAGDGTEAARLMNEEVENTLELVRRNVESASRPLY